MCGPSSAKPHALSVIGSFFSLWEDWGHSFFLFHKDWLNEWEQLWAWALRKCVLPGYHGSKLLPCVIRAELSQKTRDRPALLVWWCSAMWINSCRFAFFHRDGSPRVLLDIILPIQDSLMCLFFFLFVDTTMTTTITDDHDDDCNDDNDYNYNCHHGDDDDYHDTMKDCLKTPILAI